MRDVLHGPALAYQQTFPGLVQSLPEQSQLTGTLILDGFLQHAGQGGDGRALAEEMVGPEFREADGIVHGAPAVPQHHGDEGAHALHLLQPLFRSPLAEWQICQNAVETGVFQLVKRRDGSAYCLDRELAEVFERSLFIVAGRCPLGAHPQESHMILQV